MPVNTASLKTFAPAMRRQLIEAVGRKLDRLLTSQTPDTLTTYASQIAELREQEKEARDQLLERVAYTWFNRLSALRYLDARGWHPFGAKVLMPATEAETQPELLKLIRAGSLPAELKTHTSESRLHGLLDGEIPTAIAGADPEGEVYQELVLATCRFYHELLPNLFEGLDDATELLLPDDLLTEGSIAAGFRRSISDADCDDVELLGWLYQFYIAEKKDEVMARKKAVPTEDIPAVTQLFTPHWIVRYLVENSLGRLWLLNRPGSKLSEQMPYYIEGEAETDFLKINKTEEIKLLDPACGSGHMLTYAFDLLTLIYEEEGYAPTEIPALILRHNLHGLEICPRAAQLAELALVFKAREKSRRFFQPEQLVRPRILELQNEQFEGDELNDYIEALGLGDLFDQNLFKLLRQFEEAKTFGSLIQPCLDERAIANARRAIEAKDLGGQLFLRKTHLKVLRVLKQAEALTQRYHVVVANPPYMGSRQMNAKMRRFSEDKFPESKADLFAMFIERSFSLAVDSGFFGLITMQSWMFLSSFEGLRANFLRTKTILSMAYLGARAFDTIGGEVVQATSFVASNFFRPKQQGVFLRLTTGNSEAEKAALFREVIEGSESPLMFRAATEDFKSIPGAPIAFWVTPQLRKSFNIFPKLCEKTPPKKGIDTGDNDQFLRLWFEPSLRSSDLPVGTQVQSNRAASRLKWHRFNKGGTFRKWYGNNLYTVNWLNDGADIRAHKGSTIRNEAFLKRNCLTWSDISSSEFGARYSGTGFLHDNSGPCVFGKDADIKLVLAFLCSKLSGKFLALLNPTLHFQIGNVASLPVSTDVDERILELVDECIALARADWDNFETSWDFRDQPLLRPGLKGLTLEASWRNWEAQSLAAIRRMQELETENNQLFIAAYGLDGELQPEVPDDQITLARAEARTDVAAFLSYAVGCMIGRYSPDHPGLILANAGDTLREFLEKVGKPLAELTFATDEDGIIPVLDGEWFEDDVVARTREFLRVTFPESSLGADLGFIETSLGKDIRKYYCTDFYKDHLQTYKKRPIYWLVQSPKKSFACLIYLHRYTKDTLNLVLNNYLRPYIQKLEARLAQLGLDQLNDDLPAKDGLPPARRATRSARPCGNARTGSGRRCCPWLSNASSSISTMA